MDARRKHDSHQKENRGARISGAVEQSPVEPSPDQGNISATVTVFSSDDMSGLMEEPLSPRPTPAGKQVPSITDTFKSHLYDLGMVDLQTGAVEILAALGFRGRNRDGLSRPMIGRADQPWLSSRSVRKIPCRLRPAAGAAPAPTNFTWSMFWSRNRISLFHRISSRPNQLNAFPGRKKRGRC